MSTERLLLGFLFGFLLGSMAFGTPGHAAEPDDAAVARLISDLGLQEDEVAVRDREGWIRPDRIVIRSAFPEQLEELREVAGDVELIEAANPAEAEAVIANAQAMIGFCDARLIDEGAKLHWIQTYSTGVERCVTLPQLRERKLLLTNMRGSSGPEIAEHVIAMLLAFTRGLNRYIAVQPQGEWNQALVPPDQKWELEGRTLLVVGLGGIGTQVARRADALGMRVVAIRNSSRSGPALVDYVGLPDELLTLTAQADAVVNSVPLTASTQGLFDAEFFTMMKPTAYFINVGRGKSVVTGDLVAALSAGQLAGAGLDVTDPEPLPPDHPLWQMSNVIITPHVSAGSDRIFERVFTIVRENLRRYVAGEPMLSVVNLDKGY
jgi:phosphoglycerate dehydrogenase-like enzyme